MSDPIPADSRLSSYNYELPPDRIAQQPAAQRDESRLLALRRADGGIEHARFLEIGRFLRRGDLLVLNDTRVLAARLLGERTTGGKVELLLLRDRGEGQWEALLRAGGSPRAGEVISFEDNRLSVRLLRPLGGGKGKWVVSTPRGVNVYALLDEIGRVPLPPYIGREPERQRDAADRARYQTVYAREPGAVAAPTAGLHFTEELMARLRGQGVAFASVTLHVGLGTFAPVREEDVRRHAMHRERYVLPEATVRAVQETRAQGGRVIPVGTTSCRVLEGVNPWMPGEGETSIFIHPPYDFKRTDALITNFHLPMSTLLMLVAALAGRERLLAAYDAAIREGYRFYSYGDAMMVL